jgi:hypothetical protein
LASIRIPRGLFQNLVPIWTGREVIPLLEIRKTTVTDSNMTEFALFSKTIQGHLDFSDNNIIFDYVPLKLSDYSGSSEMLSML